MTAKVYFPIIGLCSNSKFDISYQSKEQKAENHCFLSILTNCVWQNSIKFQNIKHNFIKTCMLRAENPQQGSSADEKKCMSANIFTNITISMSNGQISPTNITKCQKVKHWIPTSTGLPQKICLPLTSDVSAPPLDLELFSPIGTCNHLLLLSLLLSLFWYKILLSLLLYNFSPTLGPAISSCCKSCQIFLRSVSNILSSSHFSIDPKIQEHKALKVDEGLGLLYENCG